MAASELGIHILLVGDKDKIEMPELDKYQG